MYIPLELVSVTFFICVSIIYLWIRSTGALRKIEQTEVAEQEFEQFQAQARQELCDIFWSIAEGFTLESDYDRKVENTIEDDLVLDSWMHRKDIDEQVNQNIENAKLLASGIDFFFDEAAEQYYLLEGSNWRQVKEEFTELSEYLNLVIERHETRTFLMVIEDNLDSRGRVFKPESQEHVEEVRDRIWDGFEKIADHLRHGIGVLLPVDSLSVAQP
jgi:hypothetical protein